jgi:hypothetical protein
MQTIETTDNELLAEYVPLELQQVGDPDTAIPELAKNVRAMAALEEAIRRIPTGATEKVSVAYPRRPNRGQAQARRGIKGGLI